MAESSIVGSTARGWAIAPVAQIAGNAADGFFAALFEDKLAATREVSGMSNPNYHIVAMCQANVRSEMWIDNRKIYSKQVMAGSVQLVRPGSQPRAVIRGPIRSLQLYLPRRIVSELCLAHGIDGDRRIEIIDTDNSYDPTLQRIGQDVLAEMTDTLPLAALRMDTLCQELAIQLLRRHSNLVGTTALTRAPARGGLAPWQLKLVTRYMEESLADDVCLTDLSRLVDLSPAHFARAFRQSTGVPPHTWLIARRVARAKELLESTGDDVLDIALACGFSHGQHLARAFLQQVGVSPSRWRRDRRL